MNKISLLILTFFICTTSVLKAQKTSDDTNTNIDLVKPSEYATELGVVSYSEAVCTDNSFSVKVNLGRSSVVFSLTKNESTVTIKDNTETKTFTKNNETYEASNYIDISHKEIMQEVFEDFKKTCTSLQFYVRMPAKASGANYKDVPPGDVGSANWSKRRCAQEISDKLGCGGRSHVTMDCVCAVGDYACVCYGGCN